jgi:hypothetical protein
MTREKIENICNRFVNKKCNLEELQSRLRTVSIDEPDVNNWSQVLSKLDNELEEIIFSKLPENRYELAVDAVKRICDVLPPHN